MGDNAEIIIHIPAGELREQKPSFDCNYPADVRYNTKISWIAKSLYCEIRALSSKYGFCWAKNEYFEKVFEVDKRTIIRRLKELETEGFIEILKARNDCDGKIYRIIRIAGSKIQTREPEKEPEKEVTKMSPKRRQNCHQRSDKTVTHGINLDNNIMYNRARARDNINKLKSKDKKPQFFNYEQRDYDFDALEAVLLHGSTSKEGAGG